MDLQRFPYLFVKYALQPAKASVDFSNVVNALVSDEDSAARLLNRIIDQGRKAGIQLFLTIEYPRAETLETDRLNTAIRKLPQQEGIYSTSNAANYDAAKLFQLVGL